MKKIALSVALLSSAFAVNAADLHPTCQEYFKQIDSYAAKQPAMKAQFDASKAQFSSLPAQAQEQACKSALEQLKQMPKM